MQKFLNVLICLFLFMIPFSVFAQQVPLPVMYPLVGGSFDISEANAKRVDKLYQLYEEAYAILKEHNHSRDEEVLKLLTPQQREMVGQDEYVYEQDVWDVSTWGCSWYCGGGPDSIFASSSLQSTAKYTYLPDNLHDFSLRTAWVEGVEGDGIGESLTFRFWQGAPPVTLVYIFNGYLRTEKTWRENNRVKQLKMYINDRPLALLNLMDTIACQVFEFEELQGKDGPLFMKFEIMSVYKGTKYDDTAISEINFDGTGVHCFAAGTRIAIPGGETEIEKLKPGDAILSYDPVTGKTESDTILAVDSRHHHNLYKLDFEGTEIVVTDDHPFFSGKEYYSVIPNNKYGVQTKGFEAGAEILYLQDNKQLFSRKLSALKKTEECKDTYTITRLSKNKLFFANGLCVLVE